jgi:hypothetical protein
MQTQGDSLDPKVRERFNPITFIAQQLLRNHPKFAKTPRRQGIYENFRSWSDFERGRREMLRRQDVVAERFGRYMLKSNKGVSVPTIVEVVVPDIDETLGLEGILLSSQMVEASSWVTAAGEPSPLPSPSSRNKAPIAKKDFLKNDGLSFDQFWFIFANIILKNDVVPYSALLRGAQLKNQKVQQAKEAAEAREKVDQERAELEALEQRQLKEYTALRDEMLENAEIQSILNDGKILTGDDVRPGDAGFEHEVPPKGQHVTLLFRLLMLLGFETIIKEKDAKETKENGGEKWWDDELASCWATLQQLHCAELCDGVVEAEVLDKAMVPPVGYILLKNRVLEELENRDEEAGLDPSRLIRLAGRDEVAYSAIQGNKKPSKRELCQKLHITTARIEWLHRLFQSFVRDGSPGTVCNYPEDPAAINKTQMAELMREVRPEMDDTEFEMRFRRIDEDCSGRIEFDEFVYWVGEDEVRVNNEAPLEKMPFEDLAHVFDQSVELIKYLHDRFQDRLPEGEQDDYPQNACSLPLEEIRALVMSLAPSVSDSQFQKNLDATIFSAKVALAFDEFLEVLPFDELPQEIQEPFARPTSREAAP